MTFRIFGFVWVLFLVFLLFVISGFLRVNPFLFWAQPPSPSLGLSSRPNDQPTGFKTWLIGSPIPFLSRPNSSFFSLFLFFLHRWPIKVQLACFFSLQNSIYSSGPHLLARQHEHGSSPSRPAANFPLHVSRVALRSALEVNYCPATVSMASNRSFSSYVQRPSLPPQGLSSPTAGSLFHAKFTALFPYHVYMP